jgi:hypothetical protein
MATTSHISTIRRVAQISGATKNYFKPEEGKICVHDIDQLEALAFNLFAIRRFARSSQSGSIVQSSPLTSHFLSYRPVLTRCLLVSIR